MLTQIGIFHSLKKWKQLVRECHPDKYLIRGLPSEAVVLQIIGF